jgi:cell division protein FtsA
VLIVEVVRGQATIWGWDEIGTEGTAADQPRAVASALETALTRAEAAAHDRTDRWLVADHVIVGLPASQLRGWAWPVKQQRPQPRMPVDEPELEALLKRGLRLTVNRQIGMRNRGWFLVDARPVNVAVDGMGVSDPVGFRGREIAATVFAALAKRDTVGAWRIVADELKFATLDLVAAPLAVAATLSEPEGLLIDVGEVSTDVTWWRGGCPVALDWLPIGGAALTDALLRQWQLDEDKAEALKRAYAAGQLRDEAGSQVREVLSPALEEWQYQAHRALTNMSQSKDQPLPQRVYLCGGTSALGDMLDAARALVSSDRLWFDRAPVVKVLKPRRVSGVINRTELGQRAGDVPALAMAAQIGRQGQTTDRPARVLKGLCQA